MKKIRLKSKLLYICCFLTIILFLYTLNVTSSRYLGKVETDDDVVAVPIFTLNNNERTYTVADIELPGDEYEILFKVSNVENGIVNDVLLNYNFKFSTENIPLTFKLYEVTTSGEVEIPITNKVTGTLTMDYHTPTTKDYKLKIIWDEKDNNYEYADKNATFKIELNAVQVV